MSYVDVLKAEYKLVYSEVFRRKTALVTLVLYPYIFTAFTLFVGYAAGSPRMFVERVGVDPVVYMITASFMLMSILVSIDELLWRPLFDTYIGTITYILASPISRLKLYSAIPIPRLTLLAFMGFTSIVPVYTVYYGLSGLVLGLVVVAVLVVGCLVMIPFAIVVTTTVHRVGESWRALNIVRPLMMVLLGVYYPRTYMPLVGYIISSLIPSSHVVEVVQRLLTGMQGNLFTLFVIAFILAFTYTPLGQFTLKAWEHKKVKEGVKTS
ncbi:MAG: ABC transporter permease [Desulfurococcaceae archaeon]